MASNISIFGVLALAVLTAIVLPAASRFTPAAANRTAATNTSVAVTEPLAGSILGLLVFIGAALLMATLVSGGDW